MTIEEMRKKREDRWERIRALATQHSLLLTQLSPRRFLVVHLAGNCCVHNVHDKFTCYQSAQTVFGPATHEACVQYIADNTEEVPEDLRG